MGPYTRLLVVAGVVCGFSAAAASEAATRTARSAA